jgi:hypothetical protein
MVPFMELITLSSKRNRRSYCQYGEGKRNATTRRRRSAVLSIGPVRYVFSGVSFTSAYSKLVAKQ